MKPEFTSGCNATQILPWPTSLQSISATGRSRAIAPNVSPESGIEYPYDTLIKRGRWVLGRLRVQSTWEDSSTSKVDCQADRPPSGARRVLQGYHTCDGGVFECQYRTDKSGITGRQGSPRDPGRFWGATNVSVAGERQEDTGGESKWISKWIRDTHHIICGHLQVGNHLQAQFVLLCDLLDIQKPGMMQPLFQEPPVGLAWGVWHVPACVYEGHVIGDVRGIHEQRCGILSRERLCRDGGIEERPRGESTAI